MEGGYYRRSYTTKNGRDFGNGYQQPEGTAIYFLLTPDSFSALHKLVNDELYHFYMGDPVELNEFSPEGDLRTTKLGQDLDSGQLLQYPVKAGNWQGSKLVAGGAWALLGTTMSPGFSWEGFTLAKRKDLVAIYPEHEILITELTRE